LPTVAQAHFVCIYEHSRTGCVFDPHDRAPTLRVSIFYINMQIS